MPAPMPPKPTLAPHEGRALAPDEVEVDAHGRARLRGVECRDCGMRVFPVTEVCPGCLSSSLKALPLAGAGRLYSYTTVHVAPPGWQTPYVVGYVDLSEGVRLFGKVRTDRPEALGVDMPVEVRVIASGDRHRYYFEPAKDGESA